MVTLGDRAAGAATHLGRPRTDCRSFRYYVEQITRPRRSWAAWPGGSGGPMQRALPGWAFALSEARRGQIEESFTGVTSSNDYLERTSTFWRFYRAAGVALAIPPRPGAEHIIFAAFHRSGAGCR